MAQASIHFEPVKGGSEEHNKRLKFLDYVHPERTRLNQYWETDTQAHRLEVITQNYLEHHPKRKKLHAKATPIREAVVNITEDTTKNDLVHLAERLRVRFGIEVFQFAIHRDEGYVNSKDGMKLNLHAHLVADWTDHEKGESIKLSRQDMAKMQTICAEVLGMERGVSSDKKHLSAMQYKEQKAKEEAEKAIRQKDAMTAKCVEALRTNAQQLRQLEDMEREKNEVAKEVENLRSESIQLSNSAHRLRMTRKSLTDDISGLTAQKEEIGSQAESLANVVQAARSDLSHLNAQKIAVSGEILNLNQERDKALAEAEQAKAQKRAAEAEAAKGLAVGAAKKLGNVLGIGSEARQLKELPKQLEAARAEGEKAAVTKILDVARLNFGDKEVTPEMIGKAWRSRWDEAKNARAETERQVKNANAHASGLEKILDAFMAIPIIRACVRAIVAFVRQGSRSFDAEDTALLRAALGGDPNNAAALRKIAYYNGGSYAQPHLSNYWDRAEMCMEKIARGENQEQDQGRSQSRGLHY